MITYTTGNIFDSGAECLVNTVNCEGYMGKGIAYQFKLRYPENNKDYVRACKSGELRIGTIHWFTEDGKLIVNFPTKNKWREKSQMSYVEGGLDLLVELIKDKEVKSIAIPPLGCGNGGLVWGEVKQVVEKKLNPIIGKCDITVYEPSKQYKAIAKEVPKLSVSSLVLLQVKMHLNEWGYLRMQKACFFVNFFLGDNYFKFDKWKFGPYSHAVDIVAKGIKEYQDYYHLDNSKDTYEQAYQVVISEKTNKKMELLMPAIEKATAYVNRIKNNKELEGISTVLFLIQNNMGLDEVGIVKGFKEWSEDKASRFSEQDIVDAILFLLDTGIIMKNIVGAYEIC